MPWERSASATRSGRGDARFGAVLLRLFAGAVFVYLVGLGVFAVLHYSASARPSAGRVFGEFHAWLGIGPSAAVAAPVEAVEPPVARLPKPAPEVEPPPPPPPPPPDPLDEVERTIRRIADDAPGIKRMARGAAFDDRRIAALAALSDARAVLNGVLDLDENHDRANELWDRLQQLYVAIKKL